MTNSVRRGTGLHGQILVLITALASLFSNSASASILGLPQTPVDLYSEFIHINYVAGTNSFSATGYPKTLDLNGSPPAEQTYSNSARSFDLEASIDSSGHLTAGVNTITIKSDSSTTLLTGTLTNFGYTPVSGTGYFEFLFTTTGGTLASNFTNKFGVKITSMGEGLGSSTLFSNSFANSSTMPLAVADTVGIAPEPASLVMWSALSIVAALGYRCRGRKKGMA
jgi:hypothetical protein